MNQPKWLVLTGAVTLTATIGCGTAGPTAPGSATPLSGDAGASGETLKIGAPAPQSPTGNIQLTSSTVLLTYSSVVGIWVAFVPSYQIELRSPAGVVMANPTVTTPTCTITATLDVNAAYTWRVRAVYQGAYGPWSSTATFRTPVTSH